MAEGRNLQTIHDMIMPKWKREVVIPQPKMAHCSKSLLVMEYLEGIKLVDGIRNQYKQLAEAENRSFEEMVAEQKAQIEAGTFHFKSIEESRAERQRLEWYLYIKDSLRPVNIARFAWNSTLGWISGTSAPYERTILPIDLGRVLEVLSLVHGEEIFEHGEHMHCYFMICCCRLVLI